MTSSKSIEDDEYVAKLLAEDAEKSSLRYARQGLSALLPRRSTGSAPKPNTRFLKTIFKEVDSHNAALKKKEELEAQIRQRELRMRSHHSPAEDTYAQESEPPRKRRRYGDESSSEGRRRLREEMGYGRLNASSEQSRNSKDRHERRGRLEDGDSCEGQPSGIMRQERRKHTSRSNSKSRTEDRQDRTRIAKRGQTEDNDWKRRRHTSRPVESLTSIDQQESKPANRNRANIKFLRKHRHHQSEDDGRSIHDAYESDPLEMLVGPLERPREKVAFTEKPLVRSKGRGVYRQSGAAMDAHFSSDYNPALDLHPESELDNEREDWDMALEALRDREMFKQKHAERLREAGFEDAEIKKWKDSGKEKNVEDVRWTSKGEAREWDLGKVGQYGNTGRSAGIG